MSHCPLRPLEAVRSMPTVDVLAALADRLNTCTHTQPAPFTTTPSQSFPRHVSTCRSRPKSMGVRRARVVACGRCLSLLHHHPIQQQQLQPEPQCTGLVHPKAPPPPPLPAPAYATTTAGTSTITTRTVDEQGQQRGTTRCRSSRRSGARRRGGRPLGGSQAAA